MMIRAYLRASTSDQDANRARDTLKTFASEAGHRIAGYYTENESGAKLERPELFRLIDDSESGDVLLLEQVDRLARLNQKDWDTLKDRLKVKGVLVVALDLPTSHRFLKGGDLDNFDGRMLSAINGMMLDMLAAIARKDYEDRRRRQAEGVEKAKAAGVYKGRPVDDVLHKKISTLLGEGKSIRNVASLLGCSTATVQRVRGRIAS